MKTPQEEAADVLKSEAQVLTNLLNSGALDDFHYRVQIAVSREKQRLREIAAAIVHKEQPNLDKNEHIIGKEDYGMLDYLNTTNSIFANTKT